MSDSPKDEDMPASPLSALVIGAVQMFEFFVAMQQGGFNEKQALYLTGQLVRGINDTNGVDE